MTTDTMRQKFEEYARLSALSTARTPEGGYWSCVTRFAWRAYQQGQRDLIEPMHVVGYRYYVDKFDCWELVEEPVPHRICYPVYALSEDVA